MVGSRIRRVHLLKSDLRPRGESLGAATLPRFAVNLQNRFWVGSLAAKAADCKSVTRETPMVRVHLCPLKILRVNGEKKKTQGTISPDKKVQLIV